MSTDMDRGHRKPDCPGSVTVFMAMVCGLIAALLLSATEAVRTQGARLYLSMLSNSAMDSLFSQYHKALWEDYRLLGLEHYSDEQLTEEFKGFAEPYLEAKNYYPLKLNDVEIKDMLKLTDNEGEIFEEELLSYMRYGVIESLWDTELVESLIGEVKDGLCLSSFQQSYGEHTRSALRLEEALERLGAAISEQERYEKNARGAAEAYSTYRLRAELSDLKRELLLVEDHVEDYKKRADELREELSLTRAEFDKKLASGELSRSTGEALLSEIDKYGTYVEADGERRRLVEALPEKAKTNIGLIDEMLMEADRIDEFIASYIPEEGEDGIDIEGLWSGLSSMLSGYVGLSLDIRKGVEDKEKEKKLESIMELLDKDILDLLLPEGAEPERKERELAEPPSETCYMGSDGYGRGVAERLLLAEYMGSFMNYFGRKETEGSLRGSGAYEIEYMLYGGESDREDLEACVRELLLLRSGLDLIHIFSDSEKRGQAERLAVAISGALGFTPITGIMTFFIMSVWALAQAFCDVKALLAGKKVRLMHTKDSFSLSLDELLSFEPAKDEKLEDDTEGFGYIEYLKLLFIMKYGPLQAYRCMDMIQLSIAKGQSDFRMEKCTAALELSIEAESSHIFTETSLLKGLSGGRLEADHSIRTETVFSY